MFATLLLCLAPCQQLDELADTLSAATDKTSYEDGAYDAARQLADLRSAEAMELRLDLFEKKMDTYRGVYLREWFYSGYLKASSEEEGNLMAEAAADRRRSDWHRILLLRSLARCSVTIDAPSVPCLPKIALISKKCACARNLPTSSWSGIAWRRPASQMAISRSRP
ncbi:MAG: hypothetical protein ACYSU1_08975 [Planctomycetota bacterium]|jgi:hypothetical protein